MCDFDHLFDAWLKVMFWLLSNPLCVSIHTFTNMSLGARVVHLIDLIHLCDLHHVTSWRTAPRTYQPLLLPDSLVEYLCYIMVT